MQFTNDFITMVGEQESPATYLRWSLIAAAGAALARNARIEFGPLTVYPNQYIILMGAPGSRKSTGMTLASRILREAGYEKFAPSKGRKEALWARLARYGKANWQQEVQAKNNYGNDMPPDEEITIDDLLADAPEAALQPASMFIVAPEWVDFMGRDEELMDSLTDLWDNLDVWDYERTTKSSLLIKEPTISMLGAATPSSFSRVIPATSIGGGFMRRILLIHGKQIRKVFWPDHPDKKIYSNLVSIFEMLLSYKNIVIKPTEEAKKVLKEIYNREHFIDDSRFDYYVGVRYTHLLKLCIISAAARDSRLISVEDVVQCNTILSRAELAMPQAMGHFGVAKNSTAANVVLDVIKRAKTAIALRPLFKQVGADVGSMETLKGILDLLVETEKIKRVRNRSTKMIHYIPYMQVSELLLNDPFFDQGFLTEEEQI